MTKSFVLYTVLEVEGELVNCIYFTNNECRAQPVVLGVSAMGEFYKPTEEDQSRFCRNTRMMRTCPRAGLYHEHLRAIGLEKSKEATAD